MQQQPFSGGSERVVYWPRMPEATNASTVPPSTGDPTETPSRLGACVIARIDSGGRIHAGRSTATAESGTTPSAHQTGDVKIGGFAFSAATVSCRSPGDGWPSVDGGRAGPAAPDAGRKFLIGLRMCSPSVSAGRSGHVVHLQNHANLVARAVHRVATVGTGF